MTSKTQVGLSAAGIYFGGMLATGYGWVEHYGPVGLIGPFVIGVIVGKLWIRIYESAQ